jgi:hypothetical protein
VAKADTPTTGHSCRLPLAKPWIGRNPKPRNQRRRHDGCDSPAKYPEFVDSFIGMPLNDWADALVQSRDDLAHVLTYEETDENQARMAGLSQSAHFLSILSLLRIAGLGDAIKSMPTRYRWRAERDTYEHFMRAAGRM